jgi:hypothetical protein
MRTLATRCPRDYSIPGWDQFHFERHFPPVAGLCNSRGRPNGDTGWMKKNQAAPADAQISSRRRLPLTIWALGFGSLLMDTSSELVHSLSPVLLVTLLGASVVAVGIIEGVAEGTAAVTGDVGTNIVRDSNDEIYLQGIEAVSNTRFGG